MTMTDKEIKEVETAAREIRHGIVEVTGWCGGGHLGGSLSMVEILSTLYFHHLNIDPNDPEMPHRDRMILSKGHGGLGFAVTLAKRGFFDYNELKEYNDFKSAFGMHLDSNKVKGCDTSNGSLGHGLSQGVGLALGARFQNKPWYTYCILGDGECNEGSIWEAAMMASHYKTTNLITFIDRNRLMIDGKTEDIMNLEPFRAKWEAFGFIVKDIDGHSVQEISDAIEFAKNERSAPVAIIANTIKGKGVDFMENQVKWHYGGLDSEHLKKAQDSISRMYDK
jgi:transketolase